MKGCAVGLLYDEMVRVWDYFRMKVCACEIITGGRGVLVGLLTISGCTDGVRTTYK